MLGPQFWGKYFAAYDILNHSPVYEDLMSIMADAGEPLEGRYVLDAGAGTGNLSSLLKKRGAEVLALDFSSQALQIYKKKDPEGKILIADLTKPLEFSDNCFDIIFSNNVIYNIPREKRPALLSELYRVLKPEGKLVVSNVHRRYKPIVIYIDTLRITLKRRGFFETLKLVMRLFSPTLKLFYYNFIIQHQHKVKTDNLMDAGEQKDLIRLAGFRNISETISVFAGQAFMNTAVK